MNKKLFRFGPGDGDEQDTGGWGGNGDWQTDVDGNDDSGGYDDSGEDTGDER